MQFGAISSDLEARCRGYVGYAADKCTARVNSLAAELERQGRSLLGEVQEEGGQGAAYIRDSGVLMHR